MSRAKEREALVRTAETREAGVADLLDFYVRVEGLYAAASRALEDNQVAFATNTTNPGATR